MTKSILNITDGTTTISLLGGRDSWFLKRWIPGLAQPKGGGTWQQSSLSDGRRLVDRQLDNVIETFEIKASRQSADDLIEVSQDLMRLLEKAIQYWTTNWQDDPVWLEARASCETETRYSVIHNYNIPQLNNPYSQPFMGEPRVLDEITLLVEHGEWLENEPGSSDAVQLSALEAYDGRNLGNVDSTGTREPKTTDEVYIANKRNIANLTHIYIDSGGFGPNLMDAALPFDLLPAVPAVNDAVYFGIDTTVADSGHFVSLVFDLAIAQNDCTIVWEQFLDFSPFAWGPVPILQDNTDTDGAMTGDPFDTTGVNSVHWVSLFGGAGGDEWWIANVVNFVTGWWIRARVTAIGVTPTPPRQQNRDVYSIVWPYVELQSSQVSGDIAMRAVHDITMQADKDGPAGSEPDLYINRAIAGLRTLDRGEDFTAYINISDTPQNPAGITVADVGPGAWATSFLGTPTLRYLSWAPGAPIAWTDLVTITFDNTILQDFYGRFHAYTRIFVGGGNINVRLQVRAGSGGVQTTEPTSVTSGVAAEEGRFELVDMGVISIPPTEIIDLDEVFDEIEITIQGEVLTGSGIIRLVDLVLIPSDEWIGDSQDKADTSDSTLERGRLLEIDSLTRPKTRIRSLLRNVSNDRIVGIYQSIAGSPAILQREDTQRLWFVTARLVSDAWMSDYGSCVTVQTEATARYLGMRGSR